MKKITLIDTTLAYDYDYIKEFCEINDREIPQEDSYEYHMVANELREMDIDDFWANIKYGKNLDACVVMGSVGTWRGRFDIEPKVFNSLEDAISACVKDCDDIIVEQDHSTINVIGLHHDGRNLFSIRLLNGKGYDAWNKNKWEYANIDLTRRVYHETLKDYIF